MSANYSRLSFITDEITQDFEKALKIAQDYGITSVEVRKVWGKNIVEFSDEDLNRMNELLDKYSMSISVIAGPFGKCLLPGSRFDWFKSKKNFTLNPRYNLLLFDRLVEISDVLKCNNLRCFNFFKFGVKHKDTKGFQKALSELRPYVEKAESLGKILLLENEHVCFADTIKNTYRYLKEMGSDALKLNLDPGNFYSAKEGTTVEDYEFLYEDDLVAHLHIKDPYKKVPLLGSLFGVVGEGRINYDLLISQALDHNYEGYFSLETHSATRGEEISKKSLDYLSKLLD